MSHLLLSVVTFSASALLGMSCRAAPAATRPNIKPNIVLILAADAGICDYEPYNTVFKTPDDVALVTPNVRRLSEEGITFTRAHSTGAVCQPSRFSIISGLFPIRKAITGTTPSHENRLIEAGRPTLPNILRQQGYRTAIVGKWHLDYLLPAKTEGRARGANIDPSQPLPLGAEDYGFDYGFWLIKGHGFNFIDNRRIVKLTTQRDYAVAWPGRPAWPGHVRLTDAQISATLNQENVLSATGKPFTPSMVKWIRYRYDIAMPSQKRAEELTVRQVADRLGVSAGVVYYWIERGHLPARRLEPGFPYWITLTADKEAELQAWITHSHRIKPQPFRTTAARGAL